jgi:hypothetical protein
VEPLQNAACVVLADRGWPLVSVLRFHGKPYADLRADDSVTADVASSELRLGASGGTFEVHAVLGYDLLGEVKVQDVGVRPKQPTIVDGWIGVRSAQVTGGRRVLPPSHDQAA